MGGASSNDGTAPDAGHVRVYELDSQTKTWTQLGVDIDGEAGGDKSGVSLALSSDGTILAVGAHFNDGTAPDAGHVRVYELDRLTKTWTQLGADIDGEAAGDYSGAFMSVALSHGGTILAVGARLNDGTAPDAGHVRMYELDSLTTSWAQLGADIDGEAENDESGRTVALSGDGTILAVGARLNDGTAPDAGHVRVYKWAGV